MWRDMVGDKAENAGYIQTDGQPKQIWFSQSKAVIGYLFEIIGRTEEA